MEKRDATDLTDAQRELVRPRVHAARGPAALGRSPRGRGRAPAPAADRPPTADAAQGPAVPEHGAFLLPALETQRRRSTGCTRRRGRPSGRGSAATRRRRRAVIDGQSARTTEKRGPRGCDANKRVNGRKRHVPVGHARAAAWRFVAHPASAQERAGGETPLASGQGPAVPRPAGESAWADGGEGGKPFRDWTWRETCGWDLEVVAKPADRKGFAVLPRRRVVERTFAWLGPQPPAEQGRRAAARQRRGLRPPRHDASSCSDGSGPNPQIEYTR